MSSVTVRGVPGQTPFAAPEFGRALWLATHFDRRRRLPADADIVLLGDSRTQGWGEAEPGPVKRRWRALVYGRLLVRVWRITSALHLTQVGRLIMMLLIGSLDLPRPALTPLGGLGRVAYSGIGGDRVEHILYRVENGELDRTKPKLVYFLGGINNLMQGCDPADVAPLVIACAAALRTRYPSAHVAIQLEFPAHPDPEVRARTVTLNRLLRANHAAAGLAKCTLLEIDPFGVGLHSGGEPDAKLVPDGVHFSEQGYAKFARALVPALSALLKDD